MIVCVGMIIGFRVVRDIDLKKRVMYLELMRRKNINNRFNDNFGNIDKTEMRKERAMKELAEKLKN